MQELSAPCKTKADSMGSISTKLRAKQSAMPLVPVLSVDTSTGPVQLESARALHVP